MGKKFNRKQQTKLAQSEFLIGGITTARGSPDGLSLPTAPSSKFLPDYTGSEYDDERQGSQNYNKENRIPTAPPYTAFVGNLPVGLTPHELTELFAEFKIKYVRIPESDGQTKGFGYIELETAEDLLKCLSYDGMMFHERCIKVDVAASHKNNSRYNNYYSDYDRQGQHNNSYGIRDNGSEVDDWRESNANNSARDSRINYDSSRNNSYRNGGISKSRIDLDEVDTFRSSPRESTVNPGFVQQPSFVSRNFENPYPSNGQHYSPISPAKPLTNEISAKPKVDPFGGAKPREEKLASMRLQQPTPSMVQKPHDAQNDQCHAIQQEPRKFPQNPECPLQNA